MFQMTKASVFSLADLLEPQIWKKNMKYHLAIPVLIRVVVTLFKLSHRVNFIMCSEVFSIGSSMVCKILRDVVHAVNNMLKNGVCWPTPEKQQ